MESSAKHLTGSLFDKYETLLDQTETIRSQGEIFRVHGLLIESHGPITRIGELCEIILPDETTAFAEVIGFNEKTVQMMSLTHIDGIVAGCPVFAYGKCLDIMVGEELLGRVLDGIGRPLDRRSLNFFKTKVPIFAEPPDMLDRKKIDEPLYVGIKAIDGLLTTGKGQRMGIFSGSGVGKSTLLSMIARNTTADINVIALIGERRREVQEFIERDLGEEGMKRSVLIISTSDQPPLARVRCAYTATAIAEFFRDRGNDVLLMVDSITRMAMAQREIGVTLGEAPVSRGYSASVFTLLSRILERAGTSDKGSITAFYNVLVEGGDIDEPISDAVRGVLDGHILLSRDLAQKNHYPSIDITASISRLRPNVTSEDQQRSTAMIVEWVAAYKEVEDLINIGAYVRGSNPRVDEAIDKIDAINSFLLQGIFDKVPSEDSLRELYTITHGEAWARSHTSGQDGGGQGAAGEQTGQLGSLLPLSGL